MKRRIKTPITGKEVANQLNAMWELLEAVGITPKQIEERRMYRETFDYTMKLRMHAGKVEANVTKLRIEEGRLPRPIASFHTEGDSPSDVLARVAEWMANGR